tara:strand:+ start:2515 stop:2709 length:195 start_codon:yes stop_codon:yes gene_type:complete
MPKTNTELILDLQKSINALSSKVDNLNINIEIIKKNVIDTNNRLPERKQGYIWGGWWEKKENKK